MDHSCLILTCLLLLQMVITLTMLNPVYDVRQVSDFVTYALTFHKASYRGTLFIYFGLVIYLGMYIPLQSMRELVFSNSLDTYEKLFLLGNVEKNYIMAGFSLFLFVVLYGLNALIAYTASLLELADSSQWRLVKENSTKSCPESILPRLLRAKRSVSYEAIVCESDLRRQLRLMMKNTKYEQKRLTSQLLRQPEF